RRMQVCALAPALALMAAGCAHYTAKPLYPAETLRQVQERRLTDTRVLERVHTVTGEQSSAEQPIRWGRAELLIAALELNPAVGEARARLAQATASVRTARALQNPTVSLANEYDVTRASESPWLWGISTSVLLDTFLSRHLRMDLAQASVRGAHADFSDAL